MPRSNSPTSDNRDLVFVVIVILLLAVMGATWLLANIISAVIELLSHTGAL